MIKINFFKNIKLVALSVLLVASLSGCTSTNIESTATTTTTEAASTIQTESQSSAAVQNESQAVTEASVGAGQLDSMLTELSSKLNFNDTMEVVTDDYSMMLINIPDSEFSDCVLYMGSGATAEELLLYKAASSDKVSNISKLLTEHIMEQNQAFEGYNPAELSKLGDAVIAILKDDILICYVGTDTEIVKDFVKSNQ